MKFPSSLRPGTIVALAAIAIYAIPIRWIETRRLTPLAVPVSVSNGHFRTGNFKINLDAVYVVNFERPEDAGPDYLNCIGQARSSAKWTVFKNSQPLLISLPSTSIDNPLQRADWFRAAPGTYSIDVEVLPGAECLNDTKMQLVVDAYDVNFGATLNLLWGWCVFLCGVGLVLLIRSDPASFHEQTTFRHRNLPGISQSPGYSRKFGPRKRSPIPLFHRLPDFGVMYVATTLPLLILFIAVWSERPRSMGIKVHLLGPNDVHMSIDARPEPLRVWLNICGEFLVDENPVSRNQLQDSVRYELAHRPNATVYFEADGNPPFSDIAFAMNEIRHAGGQVVWLTPKTISEIATQKSVQ